jgi:hypothetical protein
MLSLRQCLKKIGKQSPVQIFRDLKPCKSLRESLLTWNASYTLLIIAPQEFVPAVKPLAEHKNKTGIATFVCSLEHIYQSYPGFDKAEQVKHCIALFSRNKSLRYAMLVGDASRFPVRFVKWSNLQRPEPSLTLEGGTIYVPVELYYAALFNPDGSINNWDANSNRVIGEEPDSSGADPYNPDRINVIPNIAVGRVLAAKASEVTTYVSKVISYELAASGEDWKKHALLVASGDPDPNAVTTVNGFAKKYLAGYTVHRLYSRAFSVRDFLAKMNKKPPMGIFTVLKKSLLQAMLVQNPVDAYEKPGTELIGNYINGGVRFITYDGHGSPDGWAAGPYSVADLIQLHNTGKLPIVLVGGCQTAQFAPLPPQNPYKDVNGNTHNGSINGEGFKETTPDCLQEGFVIRTMAGAMTVEQSSGAIAYIGATCTAGSDFLKLLDHFFNALVNKGGKTLGDTWCTVLRDYYAISPPSPPDTPAKLAGNLATFNSPLIFGIYGDPSLRFGGITL